MRQTDRSQRQTGRWSRSGPKNLAQATQALGATPGSRCGTLAWNNLRHLELYFALSGAGFVCHTVNPRLSPEHVSYIINHAKDEVLFIDETFLPLVAEIRDQIPCVRAIVLMGGVLMGERSAQAAAQIEGLLFYDDLIAAQDGSFDWPDLDENSAASLCYTSGTTGRPKGVLYSHRSTILHTLCSNQPDLMGFDATDCVLPVVPLFHVNAWGVPYNAALCGCDLVLPGPNLDGETLTNLIDQFKVTVGLGVPTIWAGILKAAQDAPDKLSSLKKAIVGGAAMTEVMRNAYKRLFSVDMIHSWGMTEASPMGAINHLLPKHDELSEPDLNAIKLKQGRAPFGLERRLIDDDGMVLPEDGETAGHLQICGHWVIDHYYGHQESAAPGGWLDTGDIASIDPDGYLTIRDRAKDIIKSGGEWISTGELEGVAVSHPGVQAAAAIAAHHEKWDERPIIIAVKAQNAAVSEQELLQHYEGKVARWQIPDKVIFVDQLPLGSTGKVLKTDLRDTYFYVLRKSEAAPLPRSCGQMRGLGLVPVAGADQQNPTGVAAYPRCEYNG
nr:long-chain fatty acid--CoA ligase [Pseudophaeobacter leonis]